jgi:RNA polymerase sigma factor (sigma-70 family)
LLAAVPSIGRASRVERPAAPGADAAGDLYERYSAQIFGYCFHQLGSREEAEDAVQTTFMNAFCGLARGIVPAVEQAWLFKIAHNVCLSRRRSSWRRGRIEAPNNMEVLQEVVPAKEKVADELIRLQDVLEAMPDGQRRAILLREWQGLSYREIAGELELSQAAVETLIFRARRALAAGLEEDPAEGRWRKRLRRGADVGGALAFLEAMLGGGGAAAVKVATVVTLAGATVVTTAADHMRPQHGEPAKARTAAAPPAVRQTKTSLPAAAAQQRFVSVTSRRDAPARPAPPSAPRPAAAHSAPAGAESAPATPPPADPAPAPAAPASDAQAAPSAVVSAKAERRAKATKHGKSADPPPPAVPPAPAPQPQAAPTEASGKAGRNGATEAPATSADPASDNAGRGAGGKGK